MRVSLDHWRTLIAVVDAGGHAQAATRLHRSQSAVTHAIGQMQRLLGVELFRTEGRRARLTPAGDALLRRARRIVAEADAAQALAGDLARGWEPEVRLAVDAAFPADWLVQALARFAGSCQGTRLVLEEVVLSGADEALVEARADLAIATVVPPGFVGERLLAVEFVAVVGAGHPLAERDALGLEHLRAERQVVIADSGRRLRRDAGWLGADQRFTVSQPGTAARLVHAGLGFAWLPRALVAGDLAAGRLTEIPLAQGRTREVPLHLVLARGEDTGPAAQALAEQFRQVVADAAARSLALP
ncbi:MAG: LysR family transcriptional regulator [Xanthomonadales bacterium]|nr:LysR family transcriptional regulator [Xanthomonadales bacterium]